MQRNYAIDFIKFYAILAVVIIHTFPGNDQPGYFILDNLSRFAVPFFFAASGYLFSLKVSSNPQSFAYFKKYVIKILKIYVSWLIFYFVYDVARIMLTNENPSVELSKYMENMTALNLLYYGQGTSGYQLWFVISLVWSTAILYLFYRLKRVRLLLVIALCFNLLGLFGQSYSIFDELPVSTTRAALYVSLFYTVLGFWLATVRTWQKYNGRVYFYLFCLFTLLQVLEGFWLQKGLDAKHGEYFFSTIFLTIFLFLYALSNPNLGKGLSITKVGANSLGIYAIHVFFIDMVDLLFEKIGLEPSTHNLLQNLVDASLVFVLSYLSYQFLQKIKLSLPKNRA
ncbi:acyltransferase [Bacillus sp. ISL-35]|uniref:acyltransferase n=1 Tax=Bacillus sp. ISL-35 TaxID=2819122 RepID=UPI001BE610A5|nr:acyltransferase [Bacillus sp. ISL-35]MBT2680631.1 acyltransferase [Bacillus sp. ISL-35]MBT2702738.1 acyltransferase [Chryseobacterium sp. ISL-80]